MRKPGLRWNPQREEFCARFMVDGRLRYFSFGKKLDVAEKDFEATLVKTGRRIIVPKAARAGAVVTLADAVARYLEHQKASAKCGEGNFRDIKYQLSRLVEFGDGDGWSLGAMPIAELQPEHLIGYLETMSVRGWSGTTCHKAATYAKAALRHCVKRRLIQFSPWEIVASPTRERPAISIMSAKVMEKILENADERERALLTLLYETAARPNELSRARWGDVRGDRIILQEHKTRARTGAARVLYLSKRARKALRELRPADAAPGDLIYPAARGGELSRTHWSRMLRELIKGVKGAKGVTAYSFRHSRATHLIEAGEDPATVARVLGNSVMMVLTRYVHVTPEHIRKAIDKRG